MVAEGSDARGRRRGFFKAAAATAFVVALAGGAAVWADGGDTTEIHACLDPLPDIGASDVLVVEPDDPCPDGMTSIHWPAGTEAVVDDLEFPSSAPQAPPTAVLKPRGKVSKKLYRPLGIKINKTTKVKRKCESNGFVTSAVMQCAVLCPGSHPYLVSGGITGFATTAVPVVFWKQIIENAPVGDHAWYAMAHVVVGPQQEVTMIVAATCAKVKIPKLKAPN